MPEPMSVAATTGDRPGSALEVLLAFTKLGVSSFGGPIAHIGYFRQEFVVRRRWLDERQAETQEINHDLVDPAASRCRCDAHSGLLGNADMCGFAGVRAGVLMLTGSGFGRSSRPTRGKTTRK